MPSPLPGPFYPAAGGMVGEEGRQRVDLQDYREFVLLDKILPSQTHVNRDP